MITDEQRIWTGLQQLMDKLKEAKKDAEDLRPVMTRGSLVPGIMATGIQDAIECVRICQDDVAMHYGDCDDSKRCKKYLALERSREEGRPFYGEVE